MRDLKNYPFKITEDNRMKELMDNIMKMNRAPQQISLIPVMLPDQNLVNQMISQGGRAVVFDLFDLVKLAVKKLLGTMEGIDTSLNGFDKFNTKKKVQLAPERLQERNQHMLSERPVNVV